MPYQIQHGEQRGVWGALLRGLGKRCPACGTGRMFGRYLKVSDNCGHCGEELHHQRADDAPPYFTIVIVGHIIVPGALLLEQSLHPPTWMHMVLWLPLTLILTLALLPCVKGAVVAVQWAARMHGFSGEPDADV
ncbi:MAG: DUF983 domain-containing protein [Alphaproteobacteria bacterium]